MCLLRAIGPRWFIVTAALALAVLAGHAHAQQPLRVVTTSPDLKALAEAVGGSRVAVESLLAPEHDPHVLEIKPGHLARARAAALVIRVGLDHEPWFTRLRLPPTVRVLDASRNVRLIQTETPRLRIERVAHVHAYGNTHYWLDPQNAIAITAAIQAAFSQASPADAAAFETNRRAFVTALEQKMATWNRALMPLQGTRVVVVHDSWSYFAEAFGLTIVAAAEPTPGIPPSPPELAALLRHMRESRVRIVIADPHADPGLVRRIAEGTGARAVTLNPSGYDYLRLFDENVAQLVAAARASP